MLNGLSSIKHTSVQFLKDVWSGVNAPASIISKKRKYLYQAMIFSGFITGVEGVIALNPPMILAGSISMSTALADLTKAGAKARALDVLYEHSELNTDTGSALIYEHSLEL